MLRKTRMLVVLVIALMVIGTGQVWATGGADLRGQDIVIGNFWENYDTKVGSSQWPGGRPRNEVDELELEWRRRIERENGFTMQARQVADWGQMLQVAVTSIMAGRPAAHAFWLQPDWAMTLYRRGLLYPISDSRVVNFRTSTAIPGRQVAYNQDVQSLFTFRGKFYAINPTGYGNSAHSAGIYFNKRLFREAGLDPNLPYDMQKAGTWTWDAFLDICKKLTRDINNNGRIDVYAMPMDLSTEILDLVAFSNGAEYIAKASGRFTNATNTPAFLEALQFCRKLKDEGVMMPRPENSNWEWYFPAFHDGKVAMMMEPEWRNGQLSNMTDDWGYVLFPKGPKSRDYRFPTDENVLVIPSTYTPAEADRILAAINLWYMPVSDDWRTPLYSSYRDRRAVDETHAMIRDPKFSAFRNHIMVPGLERGTIAWEMWWFDGDPAQLVESVSQSWNALINDANAIN
ncbi:MAG: extracellular solute-binding protein [Treponema sp.]|nr:extracellular solute-binding protein [Treponema sp.]